MLKYITEFIGTFVFLNIILNATGKKTSLGKLAPMAIGIGLTASIFLGAPISGAHFNPAVTTMMYFRNEIGMNDTVYYIMSQIAGGLAASHFYNLAIV